MSSSPGSAAEQDPFNLARFIEAQAGVYGRVVDELRSGQKRSHWMWFIFPQFEGLGVSATSHYYAIKSLPEAKEYLRHSVLGPRLVECTTIVNNLEGLSARQIFGSPDDLKFRSSMTLFELASQSKSEFTSALEKYFAGQKDTRTVDLVRLAASERDKGGT